MLKEYFSRKIGETLYRTVTSGKTLYTETYARVYKAEVLSLPTDQTPKVVVNVQAHDLCPSGMRKGGTDTYLGDYFVAFHQMGDSLESFWDILIHKCDPVYADHFKKGMPL